MPSIRSPNSSFIKPWLSHKCHSFFTMDNSMTEVKGCDMLEVFVNYNIVNEEVVTNSLSYVAVAVWLQVLLHKEPLISVFTNICWVRLRVTCWIQLLPTPEEKLRLRLECFSRFAGQFLCSYITLPLYALVTQMGTNYKAALIPRNIRDTIHGWGKAARRRRKMGAFTDDSTIHTDTSTVMSVEEDDHQLIDSHRFAPQSATEIELQQTTVAISDDQSQPSANEGSTLVGTPLLHSASVSSPVSIRVLQETAPRSSSMPQ